MRGNIRENYIMKNILTDHSKINVLYLNVVQFRVTTRYFLGRHY